MDDEQAERTIAELERWMLHDDPSLVRRLRCIRRANTARVAAVAGALTAAAILLAVGLALASGAVWLAGVAAFLAAFAVDRQHGPTADSNTAEGRRVDEWNEVISIAGAWSAVVGELRAADGLDPWCPTLRRISTDGTHDAEVVWVGQHRPINLRITRRWFADGIRWRAAAAGPVLVGHVTLQPAASGDHVVAWVHAEATRCRHSRRALRTVRRETKSALRRWATTRRAEITA